MNKLRFINDKTFKYNDEIIKKLNAFNRSQAGYREKDKQNFYVCLDDKILGVCHTKMASDWCHIKKIYYEDKEALKMVLNDIKRYYHQKVEGIQFNSRIPEIVADFKALGFIEKGRLEAMPSDLDNVFLLNTDFKPYTTKHHYSVESTAKNIPAYDKKMAIENKQLRQSLNFSSETVDVQFVALDDTTFIGGIYGNYQYDYLFINVLFVDEDYRGQHIASKLMDLIEDDAKNRGVYNLYLTTFEFQALDFYKKRGYKEVMSIYDYPIGFKEYTVYKKIPYPYTRL